MKYGTKQWLFLGPKCMVRTALAHGNSGPWTRSLLVQPSQGSDRCAATEVDDRVVCPSPPTSVSVLSRSLRRRSFCTGGHGEMEDGGVEFLLDVIGRFPLREEFADNLEHPDPVPLVLLPNSGAGLAVPADSNTGSVCAQQLGGDGNDMAGVGVRRRADASPTRLTQSTDRVNPEVPGRTKRLWLGSEPPDDDGL